VLSPFAIEAALSEHPSVAACVAFALPHPSLGETVVRKNNTASQSFLVFVPSLSWQIIIF
jgi:acyl-coenzyme A synthetase/AMP-(fatty) acid ligase